MINLQISARLGRKTSAILANTVGGLTIAGRTSEVRRRSANVVNITLKSRHFGDLFRFFYNRLMASGGNNATLVISQSAKVTVTKATAVMNY